MHYIVKTSLSLWLNKAIINNKRKNIEILKCKQALVIKTASACVFIYQSSAKLFSIASFLSFSIPQYFSVIFSRAMI